MLMGAGFTVGLLTLQDTNRKLVTEHAQLQEMHETKKVELQKVQQSEREVNENHTATTAQESEYENKLLELEATFSK